MVVLEHFTNKEPTPRKATTNVNLDRGVIQYYKLQPRPGYIHKLTTLRCQVCELELINDKSLKYKYTQLNK